MTVASPADVAAARRAADQRVRDCRTRMDQAYRLLLGADTATKVALAQHDLEAASTAFAVATLDSLPLIEADEGVSSCAACGAVNGHMNGCPAGGMS